MQSALTWSLIVPTYNRRNIILEALRHAATQTRKPQEIIVVDSSLDAAETKRLVEDELAIVHCDIEWKYLFSSNRSAAIQRNEGLDHCTGDIVFFIDDDCFMYPDYAQIVMEVFEADADGHYAGLQGSLADAPPDPQAQPARPISSVRRSLWQRIRNKTYWFWVQHIILETTLGLFCPYRGGYPRHELPSLGLPYTFLPRRFLEGCRCVYPRQVITDLKFDADLLYYSIAEDLDVSYRVSFTGAIAEVAEAKIFHCHYPSARPEQYVRSLTGFTNQAFWIKKHNKASLRVRIGFYLRMLRHIPSRFVYDLSQARWELPRVRGIMAAFRPVFQIFSLAPETLSAWYRDFQRNTYARYHRD